MQCNSWNEYLFRINDQRQRRTAQLSDEQLAAQLEFFGNPRLEPYYTSLLGELRAEDTRRKRQRQNRVLEP